MFICRECGNEFNTPQSRYFEEWDEVFSRCPKCHGEDIYNEDEDEDEDEDDGIE